MPYKQRIVELEVKLAALTEELSELRDKQSAIEDKYTFFIIETGRDENGLPYLICEQVPDWYDLSDIDDDIEEAEEINRENEFLTWSFRLSSKRLEEYGL